MIPQTRASVAALSLSLRRQLLDEAGLAFEEAFSAARAATSTDGAALALANPVLAVALWDRFNRWVGRVLTDTDTAGLSTVETALKRWQEDARAADLANVEQVFDLLANAERWVNATREIAGINAQITFTAGVSETVADTVDNLANPLGTPVLRGVWVLLATVAALVVGLPLLVRWAWSRK